MLSLVQAYMSVVTTWTALVIVGYCMQDQRLFLQHKLSTYRIDLADSILRIFASLEELLEHRLTA
jgi:hypothetical protein